MAETFYSVLGVDPDADTETIKAAYREKVKTHHPDVSDADDAREAFKRITDARDVLVDDSSRTQYDRVGHEAYVRRYLDSNAWSVDDTTGSTGSRSSSSSERSHSGGSRSRSTRSRSESTEGGENAEDYDRYQSRYSEQHRRDENPFGEKRRRERAWAESDDEEWWSTADTDLGDAAGAGKTTETTGERNRGSRSPGDQWETAQTASNVYKTGARSGDVKSSHGKEGIIGIIREIGPWLAFHFVFLVSAFVTIWLFMTWTASQSTLTVPALFVSMLLLGFSVFFSILHMISRLYS